MRRTSEIRQYQSQKDHQRIYWFTDQSSGTDGVHRTEWLKAAQPWTPAVWPEPTPCSAAHNWKHHQASQEIHSESALEGNNAPRCWGEGLICTVPVLCSASPDEGCWGPNALETPYKGSLCGFLKLILSESPEANSVQLDYHSLLLNSAVFQCLLLNEFTVFNGELLTVVIPAVKWAAFSLALYAGQPQAPREQASAPWLARSSLHLPPIHPQRIIFC